MSNVRKGREIDTALCKKGFYCETDSDHLCYFLTGSNVRTKMSHGMRGRDIGPELLSLMARQLHLTKKQFLALIDCTMDEDGYRAIIIEDTV